MKVNLVTAPAAEPVTISEIRDHLRITSHDDNEYLSALRKAAREWTESYLRRALIKQTWDEWFDGFPAGDRFELSKAPLYSVTGVYYTDYAESETTMTVTTDYVVDSDSIPGKIVLAYGKTWPSFTPSVKNPVRVRYVAGYDDDGNSPVQDYAVNVPNSIKTAIKMIIGHYYNNRELTVAGIGIQEIPWAAQWLLMPYRVKML